MTVITIVVLTVLSGFVISFIPSILAGILALLSFKAMGKKINSKRNPKVDKENNGSEKKERTAKELLFWTLGIGALVLFLRLSSRR